MTQSKLTEILPKPKAWSSSYQKGTYDSRLYRRWAIYIQFSYHIKFPRALWACTKITEAMISWTLQAHTNIGRLCAYRLPSSNTSVHCTRSQIIHVVDISVTIKLPQTCPTMTGQKLPVILFRVKGLIFCMDWYVIWFIIEAHFNGQSCT